MLPLHHSQQRGLSHAGRAGLPKGDAGQIARRSVQFVLAQAKTPTVTPLAAYRRSHKRFGRTPLVLIARCNSPRALLRWMPLWMPPKPLAALPQKLAFQYLEELASEFSRLYGTQVDSVARPYAFIKFGEPACRAMRVIAWNTIVRGRAAPASVQRIERSIASIHLHVCHKGALSMLCAMGSRRHVHPEDEEAVPGHAHAAQHQQAQRGHRGGAPDHDAQHRGGPGPRRTPRPCASTPFCIAAQPLPAPQHRLQVCALALSEATHQLRVHGRSLRRSGLASGRECLPWKPRRATQVPSEVPGAAATFTCFGAAPQA